MSRVLDRRSISVNGGTSRLSFGDGRFINRDLLLDGQRAFKLPVGCNTCPFFFERTDGANSKVEVEALVSDLNEGLSSLDADTVSGLASALPQGAYEVMLAEFMPHCVTPWSEDDYFTHESRDLFGLDTFTGLPLFTAAKYHRLARSRIGGAGLFEFLVPMMPSNWLEQERVSHYREQIAAGSRPTCFCISLLDWRSPVSAWGASENPAFREHACLAHFLLDGHHKLEAATQLSMPISMVSFLAKDKSRTSSTQVDLVLDHLV